MSKSFRKLMGVLVLAGALVPVILIAVPSAQAADVCSVASPCLPQNAGFSSAVGGGNAIFTCNNGGSPGDYCGLFQNFSSHNGVNALSGGGSGVYGSTDHNGSDEGGVYGNNGNTSGQAVGVRGAAAGSGYGGYFSAPGSVGWGAYGTGGFYGLKGESAANATNAAGVYGVINSSADYAAGVRGANLTTACCGFGVVGFGAGQAIGIGGYAPSGFGVFGWSPNNWAGWFDGAVTITRNLNVNGTLTAPEKNFRIDNPLDPAHTYLQHASVESNELSNVYSGNATTNRKGFATVKLPSWFQALNRDFRYQLTSLSGLQEVAVAHEIKNNQFVIQSQKPNSRVSWQVTGVRHDPWALAHPLRVVAPKTGSDAGKYAHPRLYGQPASKGVTALPAGLKYSKQAAAAPELNKK